MACDPVLRRKAIPCHDSAFQPRNAKRPLPDSFHTRYQEMPHKLRKTETKSTTTTNSGRNLPHPSAAVRDGITYQPNITSERITKEHTTITRDIKPDQDFQVQLPLKVKYESSIRRFSVPASTSFKDLRLNLAKKMLEDKVMTIEYKDDQGDRIVLSSDKDMIEFSRIVRARGVNPVQLRVNLWPR